MPYSNSELLSLGIDLATKDGTPSGRSAAYDAPPPAPISVQEAESYALRGIFYFVDIHLCLLEFSGNALELFRKYSRYASCAWYSSNYRRDII